MENHVSAVEQQLVDLHDEVHKISCLEKEVFRLKQHTEDLESSRNWRNNLWLYGVPESLEGSDCLFFHLLPSKIAWHAFLNLVEYSESS